MQKVYLTSETDKHRLKDQLARDAYRYRYVEPPQLDNEQWVKLTSTTATSGHYPGIVYLREHAASVWRTIATPAWIYFVNPGIKPSTSVYYRGTQTDHMDLGGGELTCWLVADTTPSPLRLPEIPAPGTPPPGFGDIYVNEDGDLIFIDDAGVSYNLLECCCTLLYENATASGSSVNDFDLDAGKCWLRVNTTSASTLSGISTANLNLPATGKGYQLWIHNVGTADLTVSDEDANSTAAYRFKTEDGNDITLTANQVALAIYDPEDTTVSTNRWRVHKLGGSAAASATAPKCRAYHDTTETVTSTSTLACAMNQERYDTSTFHDLSTNNSRLTVPSTGKYAFGATLNAGSSTPGTTGTWKIGMRVNGSTIVAADTKTFFDISTAIYASVHTEYDLTAADYVEVVVINNCNNTLTVGGVMAWIHKLQADP